MNHDTVASIEIYKHEGAIGYWQGITSSESIKYNYSVGINEETAERTISEVQQNMSMSMTLGISFWGLIPNGIKVQGNYQKKLTQDVETTYGVSFKAQHEVTCNKADGDGDKGGAGLYQFVVASADKQD